jgi:peroxin-6
MLYLGVSDTNFAQFKILQALTRKFRLDPELDLMSIVEQCPFNFTGADFYALCTDALLKAMSRKAEEVGATIGMAMQIAYPSSAYPSCLYSYNERGPSHRKPSDANNATILSG